MAGTALDFRRPKALKQDQEDSLLAPQGGIDHNFVLDPGEGPAARLVSRETGRILSVYTDCPGIQVYTANFLEARGKGGRVYGRRSGVCLETQFYPDSSNHPQWPSPLVRARRGKDVGDGAGLRPLLTVFPANGFVSVVCPVFLGIGPFPFGKIGI